MTNYVQSELVCVEIKNEMHFIVSLLHDINNNKGKLKTKGRKEKGYLKDCSHYFPIFGT